MQSRVSESCTRRSRIMQDIESPGAVTLENASLLHAKCSCSDRSKVHLYTWPRTSVSSVATTVKWQARHLSDRVTGASAQAAVHLPHLTHCVNAPAPQPGRGFKFRELETYGHLFPAVAIHISQTRGNCPHHSKEVLLTYFDAAPLRAGWIRRAGSLQG